MYTPVKQESVFSFYLSGAVAGFVSILVSHPADTVKVRDYPSKLLDILTKIL